MKRLTVMPGLGEASRLPSDGSPDASPGVCYNDARFVMGALAPLALKSALKRVLRTMRLMCKTPLAFGVTFNTVTPREAKGPGGVGKRMLGFAQPDTLGM